MARRTQVAVIGAGIAGLAAAHTLARRGIEYILLEASHRVGGRAHTEEPVSGMPLDLGCHWLHSGSINPLVQLADDLGFHYDRTSYRRAIYRDGKQFDGGLADDFHARAQRNEEQLRSIKEQARDGPLIDSIDRSEPWTALIDYDISSYTSADTDQVSALDYANAVDTGEDWPVREGFGALIAHYASGLAVTLNAAVQRIDWDGQRVLISTSRGTVEADRAILTVSTEVLGSGDIRFFPSLPDWKAEAVSSLPLGNHNRIYLLFDRDVFGADAPKHAAILGTESEPMEFQINPFGRNYVHGMTGGRFADWLERAGLAASIELAKENLRHGFGGAITDHVSSSLVTAWRGDPWTKGAYSAAKPGRADQRAELARPLDDRLFFAGEAVSREHFATAHGAYLSGLAAAEAVAGLMD